MLNYFSARQMTLIQITFRLLAYVMPLEELFAVKITFTKFGSCESIFCILPHKSVLMVRKPLDGSKV